MKRARSALRIVTVALSVLLAIVRAVLSGRRQPAPVRRAPAAVAMPPPLAPQPEPVVPARDPFPAEIEIAGQTIELPRPSIRPMTVAFGVTLLMFGLVASRGFVLVGLLVLIWGILGWIREVAGD